MRVIALSQHLNSLKGLYHKLQLSSFHIIEDNCLIDGGLRAGALTENENGGPKTPM